MNHSQVHLTSVYWDSELFFLRQACRLHKVLQYQNDNILSHIHVCGVHCRLSEVLQVFDTEKHHFSVYSGCVLQCVFLRWQSLTSLSVAPYFTQINHDSYLPHWQKTAISNSWELLHNWLIRRGWQKLMRGHCPKMWSLHFKTIWHLIVSLKTENSPCTRTCGLFPLNMFGIVTNKLCLIVTEE